MKNIGPAGALLTMTGEDAPVGAEVLMSFHLPLSHRPVQTRGKVRWARYENAGVEFMHLGLREKDELWRYYARESGRQRSRDTWHQTSEE
jgi:hypothetical protein